jgi:cytochrome c-type biogenesis protein CcmE
MKPKYIIAIILIAVAIGAIISMYGDSSTYVDFKTAVASSDRDYHVIGTLNKEKPLEYNPEKNVNLFSFYMLDSLGYEMKVLYHNTKPQDFERSEKIVIVGRALSAQEFEASQILLKCPSKYTEGRKPGEN